MKDIFLNIVLLATLCTCLAGCTTGKKISTPSITSIKPGETWPDNDGNHVQAHGGGIIKIKNTYY